MKSRMGYGIIAGLQVVALVVTWGIGSGHGARQVVEVPLAANTLYSVLEADQLHLPLSWSRLNSFDVRMDEELLRKGAQGYLWLEKQDSRWAPKALSSSRPNGGAPSIDVRVVGIQPIRRYEVTYTRAGQTETGTYIGNVQGNPEPGEKVLVTVEGGKVVFITGWKDYSNKVYGTVVSVGKSPRGRYAYELRIRFNDGRKTASSTYVWNFYDQKDLPKPGQVVNLSFVRQGDRYKITYVDLNPFWPGEITGVENGWIADLDFGLKSVTLDAGTRTTLQELADTHGRIPLMLRAELSSAGHLRPLSLLAADKEIPIH